MGRGDSGGRLCWLSGRGSAPLAPAASAGTRRRPHRGASGDGGPASTPLLACLPAGRSAVCCPAADATSLTAGRARLCHPFHTDRWHERMPTPSLPNFSRPCGRCSPRSRCGRLLARCNTQSACPASAAGGAGMRVRQQTHARRITAGCRVQSAARCNLGELAGLRWLLAVQHNSTLPTPNPRPPPHPPRPPSPPPPLPQSPQFKKATSCGTARAASIVSVFDSAWRAAQEVQASSTAGGSKSGES